MRKTLLAALAVSASIGGQVFNASATDVLVNATPNKVGDLSFALTDTYQYKVYVNNALSTNTLGVLTGDNCNDTFKYVTSTAKIDTKRVIAAINSSLVTATNSCLGKVHLWNGAFTSSAKLVVYNYDNVIPAPPYPPYLMDNTGDLVTLNAFNGPRATTGTDIDSYNCRIDDLGVYWNWANQKQVDWVNYDESDCSLITPDTGLHPKTQVFVVDPKNSNIERQCVNVTPFFSFEEAYCYFCWDTADRVTSGNLKTTGSTDICLGSSACALTGSGTTKFYLTIKFNNWGGGGAFNNNWLNHYYSTSTTCLTSFGNPGAVNWLTFTVAGVVSYSWKMNSATAYVPMGTMTMGMANGFGNNPYCGVLSGSVKITETTTAKIPVCPRDTLTWADRQ